MAMKVNEGMEDFDPMDTEDKRLQILFEKQIGFHKTLVEFAKSMEEMLKDVEEMKQGMAKANDESSTAAELSTKAYEALTAIRETILSAWGLAPDNDDNDEMVHEILDNELNWHQLREDYGGTGKNISNDA